MARIHIVIPDLLHRRAKAAAAMEGMTLKDWLTRAIEDAVGQPKPRRTRKG